MLRKNAKMVGKIASICAILLEGVSGYLKGVKSKSMYNVSYGKTVNSERKTNYVMCGIWVN